MKRILFSVILSFFAGMAFAQAPANYYNGTAGLTGSDLKTKLSQIITAGHQDNGYNGLWTAYQTTDRDYYYENNGSILDIYSENPTTSDPYNFIYSTNQCGNYSDEGDCYNREHKVPQSLFNENSPMKSDANFIRATDGKVNGIRSNYPFGKVGSATNTSLNGSKLGTSISTDYSGVVFEPIDEFKGDVARMIFYFVTRYQNSLSSFSSGDMLGSTPFPGLLQWELNQLLAWHELDAVSPAEIGRNNAIYTYQGNRNPYIDNPNFVNLVWGGSSIETQIPTTPTNLTSSNITATSVDLSWNASTDNIGVTGYTIYVNNVIYPTINSTSATISNLNPSTSYNFKVIAKDAAGNLSTQSNTATATTLTGSCGSDFYNNIPAASNTYSTRTWTNNSVDWTATLARTDQTITDKAITIRNSGSLTSSTISGGINEITVTTQLKYAGSAGNLTLAINGVNVGNIPYNSTPTTTTISNLNTTGNFTIKLTNSSSSNKVAIDNLYWTCGTLSTIEASKTKPFIVYPNPVRNNEIFVKSEGLEKISEATIFDLSGKLILKISEPFKNSNKINLNHLSKGTYILKTDNISTKFTVE